MLEFAKLLEWNPSGIKRNSFVKKGKLYGFENVSYRQRQTDDVKNRQYELLVDTDGQRRWLHLEKNLLVLFFPLSQYRCMKALDSSRDEPAIRYEIEKCEYTNVVYAKHPPMIKLEWYSIEVYCKRIQLENIFWGEGCVSLCLWFM